MSDFRPVDSGASAMNTRRYVYQFIWRLFRDTKTGVEFTHKTATRRREMPTSRYMPHQGARECARRRNAYG